ncbi:MAG: hypothetical protein COA78_15420 [Blastopirellula sp.]|nr:MAG: hypothetical protein COA78_15420 [Blastopirellula sp.]
MIINKTNYGFVLLAIGTIVSLTACRPTSNAPKFTVNTTSSNTTTVQDVGVENIPDTKQPELAETIENEEGSNAGESTEASESKATADTDDPMETTVEIAEPPRPNAQRLLVLLAEGPMLMDVFLWIDGEPYEQALTALIDHIVAEGDTDGDGISTWDELADNPKVKYGQFGNVSFEKPMERKRLIDLYDTNRNGRVDASEVPRMVTRNRGRSQAFSVTRSYYTGKTSRTDSYMRKLLDADSDGVISTAEMQQASQNIFKLDVDDDEIVSQQELLPADQLMANNRPGMRQRRGPGQPGVFLINENTQWNQLIFSLEGIYSFGAPLQPEIFSPDNVIGKLDDNKNQFVTMKELEQLTTLTTSHQLEIRLGELVENQTKLNWISSTDPETSNKMDVVKKAGALILSGSQDQLSITIRDDVVAGSSTQQLDFLFQQYDGDKNNYLEADEYPEQGNPLRLSFAAIDADGDEKLYKEEITAAMKIRDWSTRCQIRLQGVGQQDALFASVDLNADGRLSAREVAQLSQSLASFDKNQNGQVEFDELPASSGIQFYRGSDDNVNFAVPNVAMTPVDPASEEPGRPQWHRSMDYNRDGDVSPREFLGNPDQFKKLDVDQDGFISSAEVEGEAI